MEILVSSYLPSPKDSEQLSSVTDQDLPIILCVDDDSIILFCIKMQIKKIFDGNCQIELAESGAEALEIIEDMQLTSQSIPHLIITDQIMPDMKGHELLENIHKKYPGITKVMLTGMAQHDDIQHAYKVANLFRVIEKPWTKEELEDTLKEGLSLSFGLS